MEDHDLEYLLKSYRFLNSAVESRVGAMTCEDRRALNRDRATALRKLLTHQSGNPAVTLIQLAALMQCLSNAPDDAVLSAMIADAATAHIEQLKKSICEKAESCSVALI
jgi:hypothetical protein